MKLMSDYQRRLGERLRSIRLQQGLTLQQVEDRSGGRWKGVVVGAYERGDRAISTSKLAELADFYSVPVSELLPEPAAGPLRTPTESPSRPVRLDLTRLIRPEVTPGLQPLSRYAATIQRQRGDYNGRVLTLRSEDVRALAVISGLSADEFVEQLAGAGVLAGV